MVFSSLLFIIVFLPIVLFLYYISPHQIRNFILLIASLFFYAWGEPIYILLLLASTFSDFLIGRSLGYTKRSERYRKWLLVLSIILNLAVLGFFKYADFIIHNINTIFQTQMKLMELPLPIGISFYTFQSVSYIVDIYRRKVEAQRKWIPFATYIALFPQLVAGPIVQYSTIAKQLMKRSFERSTFVEGIQRFIIGLAKKVLIANNIGLIWDYVSSQPVNELSFMLAWLGIIALAFQIYFDFSGYSDMAIGLGLMFGFRFNENFNRPYISRNITEFWRRWHISLGSWFKEYVYIPLGGNRFGLMKQIRNIFIVWALTGIWHGASWNFLLWGIYFGLILMIEKWFVLKLLAKLPNWIHHFYAIFFILCGWVLFVFEDLSTIGQYFTVLFKLNSEQLWYDHTFLFQLSNNAILILIAIVASIAPHTKKSIANGSLIVESSKLLIHLALLLLSIAYLVDASFNPFLYFRF